MTLNKREKILIISFGILLIVCMYYMLFLKPQISSIKKLRLDIKNYADEFSLNLLVKENVENMYKELDVLKAKVQDIRITYPPNISHEEVVILLRNIAKSSQLNVTSLSLGELAAVDNPAQKIAETPTNAENVNPGAQNNEISDPELKKDIGTLGLLNLDKSKDTMTEEKNAKIDDGHGYVITARLTATGSNYQIKAFLYKIVQLKNKISVKDFLLSGGDNDILSLSVTLDFYGIMDRNAKGQSILSNSDWKPLPPVGKDDLFTPFEGYFGDKEKVENTVPIKALTAEELNKFDFTIRAMIYGDNSAHPTVTVVGRSITNIDTSVPVIYGDSVGEEKVDLYVEEKDGKFYCKFRTNSESYPDMKYESVKEFNPKDSDIKLLIYSTLRMFENDKSSIVLTLTNNTKRNVMIKVRNDDKNNPRVKIKTVGDFIITEYE